jgi:hypothetical protein
MATFQHFVIDCTSHSYVPAWNSLLSRIFNFCLLTYLLYMVWATIIASLRTTGSETVQVLTFLSHYRKLVEGKQLRFAQIAPHYDKFAMRGSDVAFYLLPNCLMLWIISMVALFLQPYGILANAFIITAEQLGWGCICSNRCLARLPLTFSPRDKTRCTIGQVLILKMDNLAGQFSVLCALERIL